MKFSISCVAAATILMASGYVHQVQADNTTTGTSGRRSRGTSVRGQGREQGSQRNLAPATNTCVQSSLVCEWRSETDMLKNKYAICVKDDKGNFESKCVDAKNAKAGIDGSDTITCGCCQTQTPGGKGNFKQCLSIVPTIEPDSCDGAAFQCQTASGKGKGGSGVSYCANIAIGKGATPTFGISDECGDPFDDIQEENGEEFLNCGSCPSAMPSLSPSSFPSQSPSVGCAACPTNQAKYVVNTNKLSWADHNEFASAIGCVMASITSAAEQAAALKVITANPPVPRADGLSFVWFGASSTITSGQESTWTWTDGSGTFPGDGQKMTGPPYRNWKTGQPNGTGLVNGGLHVNTAGVFTSGDWDDGLTTSLWGALYKCCAEQPEATDFQICPLVSA